MEAAQEAQWIACDKCGKWRVIPGHVDLSVYEGGQWHCAMNEWDPQKQSCSVEEETLEEETPVVSERERRSGREKTSKRKSDEKPEISGSGAEGKPRKKYKYDRKRAGPAPKEPMMGVRGYLLKCPMCRPSRDYVCGRCKAKDLGIEYTKKRKETSASDVNESVNKRAGAT